MQRAVPGAVLAYVFFLLFPHVAVYTHTHAGGGHPHTHAFLSAHDIRLEHAALAIAPEGSPNGQLDRGETPRPLSAPKGVQILGIPRPLAHTHVQDDPNVLGLAAPVFAPQAPEARPEAPAFAVVLAPVPAILAAAARAPPRG